MTVEVLAYIYTLCVYFDITAAMRNLNVVRLAKSGGALVLSIVTGVAPMIVLFAQTLAVLLAAGLILVGVRIALIELSPTIASGSKVIAAVANVFMDTLAVVIDGIKIVVYGIQVAIAALTNRDPKTFPSLKFPKPISPDDVVSFAHTVARECPRMNSASTIVGFLAKQGLHESICPVVRATAPIRIVGPLVASLLSWGTYGWEPHPGDNCMIKEDLHPKSTCVVLGIGILIAEVLLPLLLIGILLNSSGSIIATVLINAVGVVVRVVKLAVDIQIAIARFLRILPRKEQEPVETTQVEEIEMKEMQPAQSLNAPSPASANVNVSEF